jgi:hypothetical protein
VGFDKSDGLFEVFGAIKGLRRVIDEISELIVIGIVTEGPPSRGMYLDFRIFLVHRSFPGVRLLRIGFLGRRMGLRDASVEAIVFRVGFLWTFVECRCRDTAIGFGGFCRTLLMRSVQVSTRRVALSMAGRWRRLALMADSQMEFKVSPPDKHRHAVRILAFERV